MIIENNLILFLSKVIENGYNYSKLLEIAKHKFKLTNKEVSKIEKHMRNFVWEKDSSYSQFKKDIEKV